MADRAMFTESNLQIMEEQYSIIKDESTGLSYKVPSDYSQPIREIYEAFGIKRVSKIEPIQSH